MMSVSLVSKFATCVAFVLSSVVLHLADATPASAGEIASPYSLKGEWRGDDGLTYNFAVIGVSTIEISVSGVDEAPSVVPTFNPPRITATGPEMLNGLTFSGRFDSGGFQVNSRLLSGGKANFYPESIPPQILQILMGNYPTLAVRLDISGFADSDQSGDQVLLMKRNVIKISWQSKNPPIITELDDSAKVREIRLMRVPAKMRLADFLRLSEQEISWWLSKFDQPTLPPETIQSIGPYPPELSLRIMRLAQADRLSTLRLVRDLAKLSDKQERAELILQDAENRRMKIEALRRSIKELRSKGENLGTFSMDKLTRESTYLEALRKTEDHLYRWALQETRQGPYYQE